MNKLYMMWVATLIAISTHVSGFPVVDEESPYEKQNSIPLSSAEQQKSNPQCDTAQSQLNVLREGNILLDPRTGRWAVIADFNLLDWAL